MGEVDTRPPLSAREVGLPPDQRTLPRGLDLLAHGARREWTIVSRSTTVAQRRGLAPLHPGTRDRSGKAVATLGRWAVDSPGGGGGQPSLLAGRSHVRAIARQGDSAPPAAPIAQPRVSRSRTPTWSSTPRRRGGACRLRRGRRLSTAQCRSARDQRRARLRRGGHRGTTRRRMLLEPGEPDTDAAVQHDVEDTLARLDLVALGDTRCSRKSWKTLV